METGETFGDVSEEVFTCRATKEKLCLNLQPGILGQLGHWSCNAELGKAGAFRKPEIRSECRHKGMVVWL